MFSARFKAVSRTRSDRSGSGLEYPNPRFKGLRGTDVSDRFIPCRIEKASERISEPQLGHENDPQQEFQHRDQGYLKIEYVMTSKADSCMRG